jgi:hypothetical protein
MRSYFVSPIGRTHKPTSLLRNPVSEADTD